MLRNLRCSLLVAATVLGYVAVGPGCARNVPQDQNSGKDFRFKGAKSIELEDGRGRAKDIVTYPGGDRVDWKVIEVPQGQVGRLKIRLKFKPARPGLDVAFNVYDEWFRRVGRAKPSQAKKKKKSNKSVTIRDARGKYYVQIYAPRRKDAAAYTVLARFTEQKAPGSDTQALAEIGEPPILPSVPKPLVPPTEVAGGVAGTQPGALGTPTTPGGTDPDAAPAVASGPMNANIGKVQEATDGGAIITLNRGKQHGVDRGWYGAVLQGSTSTRLAGGDFKIIQVSQTQSVAKVKLTVDQVKANRRVLLSPTP